MDCVFYKEKIKPRLLCFCEDFITKSVDVFGWYKCKNCNGHVHLRDLAERTANGYQDARI
jgi:hypothetical protein